MNNIIALTELKNNAIKALLCCLDYISQNTVQSSWTNKKSGWQEQWNQSKFTGLYGTCNAISLLIYYKDRYKTIIDSAMEDIKYLFDKNRTYDYNEGDTYDEKQRKDRCKILLEQNCHTTLKAVYFLRTIELLKANNEFKYNDVTMSKIIESVYNQLEDAFCEETGCFLPAVNNNTDNSPLTTMQAFMCMKDKWGKESDKTSKVKDVLLRFINDYVSSAQDDINNMNKFARYSIKSNFVSAIYALSHSNDFLTKDDKKIIAAAFFISMNDREIRDGFLIKDSYTVPDTVLARDTYTADARLLYLKSAIQLMLSEIIPKMTFEFFIDDFIEIINTCNLKKQYLSWDSAPLFSHNIRGLSVLHDLIYLLNNISDDYTIYKVSSHFNKFEHPTIYPFNVVLFMSFSMRYTESVQDTVREVLEYLGFNIWWATNDPYDSFVVESILDRLSKAEFIIIDCSERSANVMYEAGLSHGLGKYTLLCGNNSSVFPYEDSTIFETCIFNSNGEENPPPYRDLQKGILKYVVTNINKFSLTSFQKERVIEKVNQFLEKIVE